MRSAFEIRSGERVVGRQNATTSQEALIEYLRGLGCCDDEIVRVGTTTVSWRGAVYKAAPPSPADSVRG